VASARAGSTVTRRRTTANTIAIILIAGAVPAAAQQTGTASATAADSAKDPHTAQPERPTVATHAGTVAPGWLEIETGVERDRVDAGASVLSTPTVAKIGLARRVQLGLIGTVVRPPHAPAAFGDMAVGVKWRIAEDAPLLGDVAVLPAVKFPTGSAETGTRTTDESVLLISSHDLGGVAMDLNAGYTRRGGNGQNVPKNATLWTASFGGPLAGRVGWVAECYGLPGTGGPSGAPPLVGFLAGPTLGVEKWLVFDAGAIVPVAGPLSRALYAGAVYNVGRMWGSRH